MNVRRRTIKHRPPSRNGPKMLSSFTERFPVMDWFRKFSIYNRPLLLHPEYSVLFVRLIKLWGEEADKYSFFQYGGYLIVRVLLHKRAKSVVHYFKL